MAGIDNITKEILQEAQERAAALIAEAQKKADDAQAEAKQAAEETLKKAGEKADQDAANYGERIKSQIGLRKRQAALVAKQDIIDQVIGAAQKKLASQDAAPYFEMIVKLITSHVGSGAGEILFGSRDLERLPKAFAETVAAIAKAKGGDLKISEKAADIADGFVLKYGGVEENCTLDALFAEKRDSLLDKVNRALW
ncbi:MAG: V-type ATP synthase subunit E [Lachnospiraceae bacterium]|nr:V-type ATP synthase subunit E [Lachnospiraceae bacterium]